MWKNWAKSAMSLKSKTAMPAIIYCPVSWVCRPPTGNIKRIEKEKAKRLAVFEAEKKEAQQKAEILSKVSLTIAVEVNDQEKLYGAVSETEILEALEAEGQKIDKKSLVLEKPIDDLGIFEIGVKLHPQVIAKIRLWVTKKS